MTFPNPSTSQVAGTYSPGVLTLDIPALTPSPNTYNGAHWSRYRRLRKQWAWWVRAAVLEARCGALLWPRSRIQVTRTSQRKLDPDNAVGSLKVAIDSLRDAQVIVDDTAEHVEIAPVLQVIGRPSRTRIEVTKL